MILRTALRNLPKARGLFYARNYAGQASCHAMIDVHPQVQHALHNNKPIVALESTIITHGMPWPQNLETAMEVEELVRENGATPATIAIVDGRVKVGLTPTDLRTLATMEPGKVIKCSRRDLPFVVSHSLNGGTTVAATMIIAHMVGLKIFATGGIGGVHQQGHITMDVSADLVELGRTPVAVVCSGVKSILDIPRTLEFLETQGVCVATYGSPECRFPDFFTRDSGCRASYNLQSPKEAASLIKSLHELEMKSGILIGVPIPEQFAADKEMIRSAIAQAQADASEQNMTGKDVTPFLLAAIAKITEGNSLQSNIALIKNNASIAAQISNQLYRTNKPVVNEPTNIKQNVPLVIGASILDLSLTMFDEMPTTLNGATYQIRAKQSAGGVGRNIAEGIFKLYGEANFISSVGDDQLGNSLLNLIPQPLQENIHIDKHNSTSLCSVIFDKKGDCKLVLGNMEIHENITADRVEKNEELVKAAPLIVMDGNLTLSTMECILRLANKYQKPVFFEPTDMRIADKPFHMPFNLTNQIKMISPNIYELKQIVVTVTQNPIEFDPSKVHSKDKLVKETIKMLKLIENYFDCILVTLGRCGVVLSVRCPTEDSPMFDAATGKYLISPLPSTEKRLLRFYPADTVHDIINVSGAGDSFSSGFIAGLLRGYSIERCVALGFIAAKRALQSESAVPAQYFSNKQEELELLDAMFGKLQEENN